MREKLLFFNYLDLTLSARFLLCFNTINPIIIVVPQKKELLGSEFPVRKIVKQTQDQQWKYNGGNS